MSQQSVQIDPLNSPHPVPWNWVLATLGSGNFSNPSVEKVSGAAATTVHYYRSQSLLSPDNRYAAYSRIQMHVHSEFHRSQVSSVLFLENLETGDLQGITPASPLADNPFLREEAASEGSISIVIPISWSEQGDRLLARAFESLFGSDLASDYAVIVDRTFNRVNTVAPTTTRYTHAVLLGWSSYYPTCALFRAGNLGEEEWPLWAVDAMARTTQVEGDRPIIFGQPVSNVWMGPQMQH
ncbi:MAG: hypothetical protein K6T90_13020 [Leptolyngbyaceae cyanobacterium HOT.MB2.61]|nr:hypothetical protein [Leptolyngbyaceae cyanobacterium HOT.MB2.61]